MTRAKVVGGSLSARKRADGGQERRSPGDMARGQRSTGAFAIIVRQNGTR